jgi:hypothetical protein
VATLLTTFGGADNAGPDIEIRAIETADVARIVVVIEHFGTVSHAIETSFGELVIHNDAVAQWVAHWTVFRSMPALCISYSGLISRK